MKTMVWKMDPLFPEEKIIMEAVNLLRQKQLVAFPTETVYGVGADAFSAEAATKIFAAKNRPQSNPLLLHVSNMEQVKWIVKDISPEAIKLMQAFWPGPLSIVLPGGDELPEEVRGGKDNIGLRMPSHPVALALIEKSGPLVATSANLSGRPSPVTAQDVMRDLEGRVAAIIDGGPATAKVESTVVDLTGRPYKILRLGAISAEKLKKAAPGCFDNN
ncbi:MAG: threonylcarbamoyl-AMP synthase [Syntrophomonadaceae bacterium]|jgi:L-threonylcarbamoyladenylate synthase|nr:threonylcarbamoyl-AMP synthase [Syntrophomonadaceae bacterium]